MTAGAASPLPGGLQPGLGRLCSEELGETPPAGWDCLPAVLPVAGRPTTLALDPAGGPLSAMAAALQSGEATPASLLEQALERIAGTDPDVRAWVTVDEAGARQQAAALGAALAAGRPRGPLHGIPVGVKDLIDVAGMPTRAGSRHFSAEGSPRLPTAHAGCAQMLVKAGAVIIGKTTTHEFAFGGTTPPTRNPAGLTRIPGGSSGGSAAAVAAGHVPLALGTDTGGSVRIPSSYCGTAGLVPTPGRLPLDGVIPLAWSLDRVGLIALTPVDLLLAAQALGLAAQTGPASTNVTLAGLQVGVPAWAFDEPIDSEVAAAVRQALERARAAGAVLREVNIPHGKSAVTAAMTIIVAESADYHRRRLAERPDLFGADVRAALSLAEDLPASAYVRAQRVRQVLRAEMLAAFADVDVLAMPTMPITAPEWADVSEGTVAVGGTQVSIADAHLRYPACGNLSGLPCGTQPCGRDQQGLPIGLQLIAPPGHDGELLRVMTAFAAAAPAAAA